MDTTLSCVCACRSYWNGIIILCLNISKLTVVLQGIHVWWAEMEYMAEYITTKFLNKMTRKPQSFGQTWKHSHDGCAINCQLPCTTTQFITKRTLLTHVKRSYTWKRQIFLFLFCLKPNQPNPSNFMPYGTMRFFNVCVVNNISEG